jgi:hypothetical protein
VDVWSLLGSYVETALWEASDNLRQRVTCRAFWHDCRYLPPAHRISVEFQRSLREIPASASSKMGQMLNRSRNSCELGGPWVRFVNSWRALRLQRSAYEISEIGLGAGSQVPTDGQVPDIRLTLRRLLIRGQASLSIMDFIVWQPSCLLYSVMRYYTHGGPSAVRFEQAGDLNAGDASILEQDWRGVSSAMGNRLLVVSPGSTKRREAGSKR